MVWGRLPSMKVHLKLIIALPKQRYNYLSHTKQLCLHIGPPTYIKSKLVYLRPRLRHFLHVALKKWLVIVWSSMKFENTQAVVEFIFKGLEPPCLVLGQESCRQLLTPEGRVVKKPNNPAASQYLKVLKPIVWDQRPLWSATPTTFTPPTTTPSWWTTTLRKTFWTRPLIS